MKLLSFWFVHMKFSKCLSGTFVENFSENASTFCRIIDSDHRKIREAFHHHFFEAFGALAGWHQGVIATYLADGWQGALIATVVATQDVFPQMPHHVGIALLAFDMPTAAVAHHDRRVPAAINEDQDLLALVQPIADGFECCFGQAGLKVLVANIMQAEVWRATFRSAIESQPRESAVAGV